MDGGPDEDLDGNANCADSDCTFDPCQPPSPGMTSRCEFGACVLKETACLDAIDNDGDGNTDCADTPDCNGISCNVACCQAGSCTPMTNIACAGISGIPFTSCIMASHPYCSPEPICRNGTDEDNDGNTDCSDSDCNGDQCAPFVTGETNQCSGGTCVHTETACNDGSDNDGDGDTDCSDSDCSGGPCLVSGACCNNGACTTVSPPTPCTGNFYSTLSCPVTTDPWCMPESNCITTSGNEDGDSMANCSDTDCTGDQCYPTTTGMTSYCQLPPGSGVCKKVETACADSSDNDSDGTTDCLDTDCASSSSCLIGCPIQPCPLAGDNANQTVCDTAAGTCHQCLSDGNCAAPTPACHLDATPALNRCVECINSGHCAAPTPACYIDPTPDFNDCVPCLTSADCSGSPTTPVCLTNATFPSFNQCVQCTVDAHCSGTTPICNTTTHTCIACASDTDCQDGPPDSDNAIACKTLPAPPQCVQCTLDSHCTSGLLTLADPSFTRCNGNVCSACSTNLHCTSNPQGSFCDTSPAPAQCTKCLVDSDCPSITPVCKHDDPGVNQNKCVVCTALNDSACTGSTPVCDAASNTCVECLISSDCPSSMPACNTTTHQCVACTINAHCVSSPDGPACDTINQHCAPCAPNPGSPDPGCSVPTPGCDTLGDGIASNNTCRTCVDSADCSASQSCNPTTHACVNCPATSCPSTTCPASTPICVSCACKQCLVDDDCPNDWEECTATYTCNSVCNPTDWPGYSPSGSPPPNGAPCPQITAYLNSLKADCESNCSGPGSCTEVLEPMNWMCNPTGIQARQYVCTASPQGSCPGIPAGEPSVCPHGTPTCQPITSAPLIDASEFIAVCGNTKLEPGESCDDGNTVSDDGCTQECQSEDATPWQEMLLGSETDCQPLDPAFNDARADRINVVFTGVDFPSMASLSTIAGQMRTELLSYEPYASNREKIQFWFNPDMPKGRSVIGGSDNAFCSVVCNTDSSCTGLLHTVDAILCNKKCTSVGFDGGKSFTSMKENQGSYRPGVFTHEFQHQFAGLADEYTASGRGDLPKAPNCAANTAQAQEWWGSFITAGTAGTYSGCSYTEENVRPHQTSLMRSLLASRIGVVSEAFIRAKLAVFSGEGGRRPIGLLERVMQSLRAALSLPLTSTTDSSEHALEVTLKRTPDGRYGVAARRPVLLPHGVKPSMKQGQSITVHVGQYLAFSQTFSPMQLLNAESFIEDGSIGLKKSEQTTAEVVTVFVGLGDIVADALGNARLPDGTSLPYQIKTGACDSMDNDPGNDCPPPTLRGAPVPDTIALAPVLEMAPVAHTVAPPPAPALCGNGVINAGEACDNAFVCENNPRLICIGNTQEQRDAWCSRCLRLPGSSRAYCGGEPTSGPPCTRNDECPPILGSCQWRISDTSCLENCTRRPETTLQKLSRMLLRKRNTGTCGDRVREEDEECDDGNMGDGDGCSSICLSEQVTEQPIILKYEEVEPLPASAPVEVPVLAPPECRKTTDCSPLSDDDIRRCIDQSCENGTCRSFYRCASDGSVCDGRGKCVTSPASSSSSLSNKEKFFEFFRRRDAARSASSMHAAPTETESVSSAPQPSKAQSSSQKIIVVGTPKTNKRGGLLGIWDVLRSMLGFETTSP